MDSVRTLDPRHLSETLPSQDPIGWETLRRMASVTAYNRWIYEVLAPYAGQRVLEVGSGIGNMTAYFLDRTLVVGLDRLPASVQHTQERFRGYAHVRFLHADITDASMLPHLQTYRFDTVLCINVLEHIEDDRLALRHMHAVLQPGGHLLLLVPAGVFMYGTLDQALGHFRRYERDELRAKILEVGFRPLHLRYMNLAGIPGWYLNSRILKRHLLPRGQLRLFNLLAPLFIRSERWLRRIWDVPWGQSLVCIAEKPVDRVISVQCSVEPYDVIPRERSDRGI